jgi:hypothetical protein
MFSKTSSRIKNETDSLKRGDESANRTTVAIINPLLDTLNQSKKKQKLKTNNSKYDQHCIICFIGWY